MNAAVPPPAGWLPAPSRMVHPANFFLSASSIDIITFPTQRHPMKLLLPFFAALLLGSTAALRGDGQLTVLGSTGLQNWTSFPLQIRTFTAEQVQQPPEQWLLRLCESIDNSNLVVIGDFFPAAAHQAVFSHPAVGKSLAAFWSRGGTLFWGLLSADIIISFPAVMSGFFKELDVPFPTINFYHDPGKGKDIALHGIPAPGYDGPLLATANQQPMTLTAVRHFGRLPAKTFKPVAVARENQDWPLIVMADNILGKGRIICNYCYDLSRETNHPFYANLVTLAYGPLARHSAKQTIRQRLQQTAGPDNAAPAPAPAAATASPAAAAPGMPKHLLDLRQPQTVSLRNWRDAKPAAKSTQVMVMLSDATLTCDFTCFDQDIDSLVATTTQRDGMVWNDDSVEVNIASSASASADVIKIILNPKGVGYDAKNGAASWNGDWKAQTAVAPDHWTASLAIPFATLGFNPHDVGFFKINLCRSTAGGKELTSWSEAKNQFDDIAAMGYATVLAPAELAAKLAAAAKPARPPATAIRLWTPRPFQHVYSDTFPDDSTPPLGTLEVVAARNDREAAQVLITNFSEDNLYFRVEPQFLLADGVTRFSELVTIREAIPWRATTGQVVLSPLARLNEAGVLAVPPLETRMLWFDVKTLLPPGKYAWTCRLVPVNADRPGHDISLTAEILDLTFPSPLPVGSYTFGPYGFSFAYNQNLRRQYFQTCLDYHIRFLQTVDGPHQALKPDGTISSAPADYRHEEKLLLELGANWVYGYGVAARFQNTLKKYGHDHDLGAPAVQEKFRTWISTWARTLRADGVPFSRFLVPLQDEPAAKDIDNLLVAAKIIHEVDPAFQTTVTIATWSTRADIEKLAPAIDVWIPWEPRLTMRAEGPEELAFYQQRNKPFMTYLCSTTGNMAPYLDYFRFRGIRAFLHGADYFALWACNSWRQNPWNSAEDKEKNGAFLFLNGTEGPVPTVRAEWFREAAEDLYLLTQAARSPDPKAKALADHEQLRKLLDANDRQQPENVNAWRLAITRALAAKP